MVKRGIVWIAPSAPDVPAGRMVNPTASWFWVSWQDGEVLDHDDILGAEEAVAWGRERANRVLIRLGHSDAYFSAGDEPADAKLPDWPPEIPPEGWFTPSGGDL